MAINFLNNIDVTGEVKGTSLDINGNADVSGNLVVTGQITNAGNVLVSQGSPKLILKDSTDNDDQSIIFRNNSDNDDYKIATADFTSGGGADGFYLGSTIGAEVGLVTNNTTALTLDSSQNATFAGTITVTGADAITIPDYILHTGDTNSKFGFPSNDNFKVRLAGSDVFTMSTSVMSFTGEVEGGSLDINGNADISGTCVTGNLECSDLDIGGTVTGDGSGLTDLNGSEINTGTIASARLDADTAHLTTTQTFSGSKTFSAAVTISNATASTTKTTGALKVSGGIGVSGALNAGGDVVAYASSDKRYKDNLQPITNPIDKVKSLTGYTFTWNDKHEQFNGNNDIGVVAQEVERILPEIVDTRDNGYKAVKYEKMVALLIEAVKDQQNQIDELKEKCNGCSC